MKNLKNTAALLLAATFFSPLALAACTTEENYLSSSPADSTISESMENSLPETENSENTENESESLESSAPEIDEEESPVSPPAETPTTPPSVTPSTPSTPSTNTKAQYIRCIGNNVNIRSGAGTNYSVLGSANEGTMYAIIEKTGGWYKTYYRNKIAYIYAEYASVFTLEKTTDTDVEKVVAEGYKLIGVPYVYGAVRLHDGKGKLLSGFSAQKFDCSSLIQYIFYKGAGELLNVNTRTQVKQGKYVKKSELQRGDCIFFTNEERQYNSGIERIGHVALYLGNDYILHTSSDYARIEKMSKKRWSFYVEARRFL